jgi:hypothetical protein
VLVIAILHLIGGSLGLMGALCGGGFELAGGQKLFTGMGGPQAAAQEKLQTGLAAAVEKHAPAYTPIHAGQYAVSMLTAVMMIAAGIGLLKMRPWARSLSIAYAVLSILSTVFFLIYGLAYVLPAMLAFLRDAAADPAFAALPPGTLAGAEGGAYAGIITPPLFIIYPIAVLVIMLLPSTVAAFRAWEQEGDAGPGPAGLPTDDHGQPFDRGPASEGIQPGDRGHDP